MCKFSINTISFFYKIQQQNKTADDECECDAFRRPSQWHNIGPCHLDLVIAKLQRISGIVSSCLVSSKEFQDKGNFCSANCYKCQVNTSKFYSLNFSNSVSAP